MLRQEPLGAYNFNVLRGILEAYNFIQVGTGVEVGVFDGGTSEYLLKSFPNLRIVGVDPYSSYYEYDQERLDKAMATADARLSGFEERYVHIRENSVKAAARLPDDSFDFVFIDADHSYDAVSQDISAWYPKVRSGGLFCGHDYRWPEVTKAVGEFSERSRLDGFFTPVESDIWWFCKTVV